MAKTRNRTVRMILFLSQVKFNFRPLMSSLYTCNHHDHLDRRINYQCKRSTSKLHILVVFSRVLLSQNVAGLSGVLSSNCALQLLNVHTFLLSLLLLSIKYAHSRSCLACVWFYLFDWLHSMFVVLIFLYYDGFSIYIYVTFFHSYHFIFDVGLVVVNLPSML